MATFVTNQLILHPYVTDSLKVAGTTGEIQHGP